MISGTIWGHPGQKGKVTILSTFCWFGQLSHRRISSPLFPSYAFLSVLSLSYVLESSRKSGVCGKGDGGFHANKCGYPGLGAGTPDRAHISECLDFSPLAHYCVADLVRLAVSDAIALSGRL